MCFTVEVLHSSGVIFPKKGCLRFPMACAPPFDKRVRIPFSRFFSLLKSRLSLITKDGSVGAFCLNGLSLVTTDFTSGPINLPSNVLLGEASPTATSKALEQCASICATFIVPHWRGLSGVRVSILCIILLSVAAS